jgi:hypothetical protein
MHATIPVRRAVAVALATLADARAAADYSGITGVIDALRGGTYVVAPNRLRFAAARVVTDATADGTLEIGRGSALARLQLRGPAVTPSRLILVSTGRTIRVTGTVGHRHVDVRTTT